jgi:hypothetical protein
MANATREPSPDSFVKVSLPFLSDANLDDSEFRCLIALESWAWDKDHCWPGNVELARRCGWVKDGKPSRSKVKRILKSLEAKGCLRRVVVVAEGQHKRERIVFDRSKVGGSELTHPGSNLSHPGSNLDQDGSKLTHTVAQDQTTPRVRNDPPPVQIQTTGGSNLDPELDSATDSGNQTHRQQTQAGDPPTAAAGLCLPKPRSPEELDLSWDDGTDPIWTLKTLLNHVGESGVTFAKSLIRRKQCLTWMMANLELNRSSHGLNLDLKKVANGSRPWDDPRHPWAHLLSRQGKDR